MASDRFQLRMAIFFPKLYIIPLLHLLPRTAFLTISFLCCEKLCNAKPVLLCKICWIADSNQVKLIKPFYREIICMSDGMTTGKG